MIKYLFFIICCCCFITFINAESCRLVNGDVKKIGSEVACGDEYFYIISNDGADLKMISKYNLYVGEVVKKLDLDKTYDSIEEAWDYLYEKYEDINFLDLVEDDEGKYIAVLISEPIEYTEVKQNPLSIGAHGNNKGQPEFPEIGDIIFYDRQWEDYDNEPYGGNYYRDFIPIPESSFYKEVEVYKNYLKEKNYNIKDASIITVNEISNIVKMINGKEIPLKEWFENSNFDADFYDNVVKIGSIKDLVPLEYDWLYSTTYWTRTLVGSDDYVAFVDTLGDLCASYDCPSAIGAGLRPVITIDNNNVIIEEILEIENPNTGIFIFTGIILLIVFLLLISIFNKNKLLNL